MKKMKTNRETDSSITRKIFKCRMECFYKNISKTHNFTFIFQNFKTKDWKNLYGFLINKFISNQSIINQINEFIPNENTTSFFLISMLLDFGFLTNQASWIHQILKGWCND